MSQDPRLVEAFRLLKEVRDETGVNLIDNYSYRELTATASLKDYLPSIQKTIGRTGDDANAKNEGYFHIEEKSGTSEGKTLTLSCFSKMTFDKQNDPVRREYIFKYDGLSLSFFEFYKAYPTAVIFVPKDQIAKLHPLFLKKQNEKLIDFKKKISEGKNIGHDAISVNLKEIVSYVGKENLICWLHGSQINAIDFFRKLNNKEIKINQ